MIVNLQILNLIIFLKLSNKQFQIKPIGAFSVIVGINIKTNLMKKLIIIMLALISTASYAQKDKSERGHHKKEMRQKGSDLSPEQRAELSTKKMTLHLDLNEAQQKDLYAIELEQAKLKKERFESKTDKQELKESERFEMKTKRLDNQIAFKKKMKSILSEDQYSKWEKGRYSKRKGMKGKKKRGDARPQKR